MKDMLLAAYPYLLVPVVTALAAGTGWVAFHLGAWLREKAKTSKVAGVAAVVADLALTTVQDIEAAEKAELTAYGTKLLTPDQGAKLKKIAVDRLVTDLGANGLKALADAFQAITGSPPNTSTYLSGKVEQAVAAVSGGPALATATAALARPK